MFVLVVGFPWVDAIHIIVEPEVGMPRASVSLLFAMFYTWFFYLVNFN